MMKRSTRSLLLRILPLDLWCGLPLLLAVLGCGTVSPGVVSSGNSNDPPPYALEVFNRTNEERQKNGLSTLTWNDQLAQAGADHCQDMIDRNYFGHIAPDGATPGDRATAAGYDWRHIGENIAAGYATPQAVMTGWMNSPDHRENILDPTFTELGVGVRSAPGGRLFWAQEFGSR